MDPLFKGWESTDSTRWFHSPLAASPPPLPTHNSSTPADLTLLNAAKAAACEWRDGQPRLVATGNWVQTDRRKYLVNLSLPAGTITVTLSDVNALSVLGTQFRCPIINNNKCLNKTCQTFHASRNKKLLGYTRGSWHRYERSMNTQHRRPAPAPPVFQGHEGRHWRGPGCASPERRRPLGPASLP